MRKIEKKSQKNPKNFSLRRHIDDFEELTESVQGWNVELRKLDAGPFTSDLMQLKSGPVLLSRFFLNSRLELQGNEPQSGFRRFGIPIDIHQTSLWRGKKLGKKTIQIYPSDSELEGISSPNLTTFIFLIAEERLTELGQTLHVPLPWELPGKPEIVDGESGELGRFHQTLQGVSHVLTENPSTLDSPGLRRELEVNIPQQLLTFLSNAYPVESRPSAHQRTRALKQAMAYITDHAHEPPTVLEICQDVGVSKRTLEYAFLEYFGVSPKSYLQAYRLNGVRKTLRESDPNSIKIADVANRWGFWHMGQFAKDYHKLFGELPSETLRHSKKNANVC